MSDLALYRKYRPKDFSEVMGQDELIRTLSGAIKQGKIAHAYLFAGSRGTGKTTVARIMASKAGASNNDILEIDAASHNGVDDVRELREAARSLPFQSPVKIYIIDEVHMLSKPAFNALLKILEEPPKHVIFILATTELHKVPETIISRCQTLIFKKPSLDILKTVVTKIAKAEGYTLESEAGELIAFLGDGAFRDAIGMLQKIISSSADKKITALEVEHITGAPSLKLANELIMNVLREDLGSALKLLLEVVESGADIKVFLSMLLNNLRFGLLLKYAPVMKTEIATRVGEDQFKFLENLAVFPKSNLLINLLKQLLAAHGDVRTSPLPQLPIELALINLLGAETKS